MSLLLLLQSPAAPSSGYAYYVPLTVQSGQVTGSVTDFVALVDHTFAPWRSVANGGHVQNIGVGLPLDWQVYADSGLTTPLNYEIISWDTSTGAIVGWIQTPVATATTVYIAYGDAAQTTYHGNTAATWGGIGFVAVFHMDALFGAYWADELTTYTLTNTNGTVVTGKIDDAGDFNGTTAYAEYAGSVVTTEPLTLSCWVNPDAIAGMAIGSFKTGQPFSGWFLELFSGAIYAGTISDNSTYDQVPASGLTTGAWQHIGGAFASSSSRYAYLNGVPSTQGTATITLPFTPDNLTVGAYHFTALGGYVNGAIDEVRIHNVARSHDWMEAEYHSQNDPTAFWILGSETPVTPPTPGTMETFVLYPHSHQYAAPRLSGMTPPSYKAPDTLS